MNHNNQKYKYYKPSASQNNVKASCSLVGYGYCSDLYCCLVERQTIARNTEFLGNCHSTKQQVKMEFRKCSMAHIPFSSNIIQHMPYLMSLSFVESNFPCISKHDLFGFGFLTSLTVTKCGIKALYDDLFENTPNLEFIDFSFNSIVHVRPNILQPLTKLVLFDLSNNPGINVKYHSSNPQSMTLQKFKDAIMKCDKSNDTKVPVQNQAAGRNEMSRFKVEFEDLKKQFLTLNKTVHEQKRNLQDLTTRNKFLENRVQELERRNNCHHSGLADDFALEVNGKEFKVIKAKLSAKSAKFARLIDENPDADNLELEDVSESVVEAIVNHTNNGILPGININLNELYAACHKLEMNELKALVSNMIMKKVNPQTALDVLLLCNKYGVDDELKMKAFEEYKKNFPHLTNLKPTLASNPDVLKKLMKAKMDMDKITREVKLKK